MKWRMSQNKMAIRRDKSLKRSLAREMQQQPYKMAK